MQVELRKADFLTAHAEVAAGGELWVVELRPDREGAVAEASGDAPSNQRNRRNRRRRNMRRQETATETATETMSADTETPAMMDDPYERWD
jgi:hypothetical protein